MEHCVGRVVVGFVGGLVTLAILFGLGITLSEQAISFDVSLETIRLFYLLNRCPTFWWRSFRYFTAGFQMACQFEIFWSCSFSDVNRFWWWKSFQWFEFLCCHFNAWLISSHQLFTAVSRSMWITFIIWFRGVLAWKREVISSPIPPTAWWKSALTACACGESHSSISDFVMHQFPLSTHFSLHYCHPFGFDVFQLISRLAISLFCVCDVGMISWDLTHSSNIV